MSRRDGAPSGNAEARPAEATGRGDQPVGAPFGAILAGGRNRRYGDHKALARVGGERIIDRVRTALERVVDRVVVIANEPDVYAPLGLPLRPDARPGLGVLGGIHTALLWAREAGRPGVLAAACDMPFLSPPLLTRLSAAAADGVDVAAPASGNRRGLEPLCAYYSTACIRPIEAEFDRGDRHIVGFFPDVTVHRIPLEELRAHGEPDILFMNVNTPEERRRANRLAERGRAPGAPAAETPDG